jgi:hypothetical protein
MEKEECIDGSARVYLRAFGLGDALEALAKLAKLAVARESVDATRQVRDARAIHLDLFPV